MKKLVLSTSILQNIPIYSLTLDLLSHRVWRVKQKCNYGLLVQDLH